MHINEDIIYLYALFFSFMFYICSHSRHHYLNIKYIHLIILTFFFFYKALMLMYDVVTLIICSIAHTH